MTDSETAGSAVVPPPTEQTSSHRSSVENATPTGRAAKAAARRQAQPQPAHLGFQIRGYPTMIFLMGLTLLLNSLIFAPIEQWYLGYVCMVPWLIVVGATSSARRLYVCSWILGFVFFLINVWWIKAPTGAGYVVLSAYLACYYPTAAWAIRSAVRRRRVPLAIALPFVWVGTEFLRTQGFIAFPWFFLAHSQYKMLGMIQISDLVGAYGVTFVLASVNGAIADVVFARIGSGIVGFRRAQRRRAGVGVMFSAVLMVGTLGYGWYQLGRDTMAEGPSIAIIQRNYPNYTDRELVKAQPKYYEKAQAYFEMMRSAEAEKPDLYSFPETAWGYMFLNREFITAPTDSIKGYFFKVASRWSKKCRKSLSDWSARTGSSIVIGSASVTPTPLSLRADEVLYNSAFHFRPTGGELERHDKIHPVLFGEMVPFRFGRLRFLYLWLNSLSPFGQGGYEYSLTPGERVKVFTMAPGDDNRSYRFGVPICYEDVMPYVCRQFAWDDDLQEKRVDFLLNISNDGWFLHGNELPQHFAICTFRAVENRVGIARTVNTGVSGFIDPNGRPYDKIGVGEIGWRVAPVVIDTRTSLYSRTGDVFALVCTLVWALFCVDYVAHRVFSGGVVED